MLLENNLTVVKQKRLYGPLAQDINNSSLFINIIYFFCSVYRDLKPENILLNENMHILITDFGSAKILKENEVDGTGKWFIF